MQEFHNFLMHHWTSAANQIVTMEATQQVLQLVDRTIPNSMND